MLARVLVVVVGLLLVYGGGWELFWWLRAGGRLRRAPGVIIGGEGSDGERVPVVRFTTDDGEVVTVVSAVAGRREPRVGRRVTVAYNPVQPRQADIAKVRILLLWLAPVFIVGGLAMVYYMIFVWAG